MTFIACAGCDLGIASTIFVAVVSIFTSWRCRRARKQQEGEQ